ncbi:MAG: hypothetical protein CVV57_10000 [Tenericutes bacterium HGW-Tenericutes-2]|nr:MAG: hypothetical protein CVV57_10000 [Tenericutes bacterium HGW-Tenericutes-2]
MEPFKDNHQKITDHLFLGVFLILLSISIGSILYARLYTGNFTMTVGPSPASMRGIEISESVTFDSSTSRLTIDSYIYSEVTYNDIILDDIQNSEGYYIDPNNKYMSYSFYLKNSGADTIDVRYYMKITSVFNHIDDFIRIIVIEDDESQMYQKIDQADEFNNQPTYEQMPTGIDFLTQNIVFRAEIDNLRPGEIKFFRVIIWLEQQDPDFDESVQSGMIEVQLAFSADGFNQAGSNHFLALSNDDENLWFQLSSICNVNFKVYYGDEDQS